ncbi:MAG TPA: PQQ-binding-like beta-propeller repeat protein [Humisphaera sp.]|jgi:outer membrane protein assembly factor BamB|nr:PQQ-binding-like beta-propeller repeat protein [Humisphaera sp.]
MNRIACCLALFLSAVTAFADSPGTFDWPQWQGPNRDNMSKEKGLLQQWPKEGPPLVWKLKDLGGGYSAPSIASGRIFAMSKRGGSDVVWALSEADGKSLWATPLEQSASQGMPQGQEGPGCTPTVDGDHLYVISTAGEIACLTVPDGKIVWHHSMTRDLGGSAPNWAYRESPLVDGKNVICTPGGSGAMMVALDKLTGATVWKTSVPAQGDGGRRGRGGMGGSGAAYSSAIAIDFEGQRQYVQLAAKALIGVAADDGKLLWSYAKPANSFGINCTTPLFHDGMVFASSAYGAGGGLVKLSKDASGNITATEVWAQRRMQNHHGGVILFEGYLYGANGGNEGGAPVCLDFKTGDVLWNQREDTTVAKGSVTFADGRIYYRCEDGNMLLVEPSPKQFIERGRFQEPARSNAPDWAHPVIANGKLYLRDQDVLLCYDVKAK